MKKYLILIVALVCFVYSASFAQEEKITISTYYPSPYGVYNEVRLFPHSDPTIGCTTEHEGTMYFDSDDNMLYVCGCPGGVCGWGATGFWRAGTGADINNIHNTNSGNVGINVTSPSNRLHVQNSAPGAIRIVDGTQGEGKVLTSDANGVGTWQDGGIGETNCAWYRDGTIPITNIPPSGPGCVANSDGARCPDGYYQKGIDLCYNFPSKCTQPDSRCTTLAIYCCAP